MRVILSLFLLIIMTACGKDVEKPKAGQKPVVKIGVIYPLSGNAVDFANSAKKAYLLFKKNTERQNSKYNYELIWEDSQMSPVKGLNAANKLISVDHTDVLLTVLSRVTKAISPIAAKNKIVHLAQGVDFSVADGKYNFILTTSAQKQGEKLYEHLLKQNIKNVDLVALYDAGTVEFLQKFKQVSKDIKINNEFLINSGEHDFRLMIQKIINSHSDMVVVFGIPPEIDVFMKQYKEANVTIPVSSVDAFSYIKDLNNIDGAFFSTYAYPSENFVKSWKSEYKEDLPGFGEDNFYTRLQIIYDVYESYAGEGLPNTDYVVAKLYEMIKRNNYVIENLELNENGVIDSRASLRVYEQGKLKIL